MLRRFHVACSVAGFLCVLLAVMLTYLIVPASVRPRCTNPRKAGTCFASDIVRLCKVLGPVFLVPKYYSGEHTANDIAGSTLRLL